MTRVNYGVPYKGSKNMIAEWVVSHVPECDTFVDIFAGGCAIADCILRKGRAKHVIVNDRDAAPVKCFEMAVHGDFANESRWISREEFFALKETDLYVRYCWSFGNNAKTYLYSPTIEPYKRATHYAIVYDDWSDFNRLCPEICDVIRTALNGVSDRYERRIKCQRAFYKRLREISGNNWLNPIIQSNPLYRRVGTVTPQNILISSGGDARIDYGGDCIPNLNRLERLQSLEQQALTLETFNLDYRALTELVITNDGAFIYCDPPYRGTDGYGDFDYDAFLDWALEIGRKHPILISEYAIDHDGFIEVDAKKKLVSFNTSAVSKVTEKLYTVKGGVYATQNDIR